MDCDEVSDVEPHYSEPSHNSRLRTVSGATTYSSNQRIPDIDTTDTSSRIIASSPLNTKPHASNLFLRAWIEHLKTPAVDPTSPLHGGVPLAVNIQDTLDVLYHPASGTSYVRSLNEAPQYPLPVTTGTEELTSRRQRIQGLLDGVLSYVHVHQKENLGSQVFGPDDVVDDMPQMPTEGIVASRQARQRHVNKM
ncbi:hypothetical protein N7470_008463 [Penicillium chermesinum]|nr:hypothetical protein N7470_008463 [Penicillium chermesinum]